MAWNLHINVLSTPCGQGRSEQNLIEFKDLGAGTVRMQDFRAFFVKMVVSLSSRVQWSPLSPKRINCFAESSVSALLIDD